VTKWVGLIRIVAVLMWISGAIDVYYHLKGLADMDASLSLRTLQGIADTVLYGFAWGGAFWTGAYILLALYRPSRSW